MVCPQCGTSLPENSGFCSVCGRAASAVGGTAAGVAVGPPQTSGKAITSLVLGIAPFSIFSSVPAVVFGHIALSEIRKSGGRLQGRGMAIAGLVLGYLGIAMVPFVLIIAAIAIPNILRARIAANESSAVSSLRSLTVAQITYASAHPESGFSCDLREIITSGELDPGLASSHRHGYIFLAQNCTREAAGGPNTHFQLVAYPEKTNQTGVRAFCVDESGVIKFDLQGLPQACLENGVVLH